MASDGGDEVSVRLLMERLGSVGVTTLLKVDHERMGSWGLRWTVVMSGPGLGGRGLIRTDSTSLEAGIAYCISELSSCPGDWGWLAEIHP